MLRKLNAEKKRKKPNYPPKKNLNYNEQKRPKLRNWKAMNFTRKKTSIKL